VHASWRSGHLDGNARDLDRLVAELLYRHDHVARREMRIARDVSDIHDRAVRNLAAEPRRQLAFGKLSRALADCFYQIGAMNDAQIRRGVGWIRQDILGPQRPAQGLEERLRVRRQGHKAVGGRIDAKRHEKRVMVTFRPGYLAGNRMLVNGTLAEGENGVSHGDVQELTFSRAPRMMDRRQYAEGEHHPRHDVADPWSDLHGRPRIRPGDGHQAAHRLRYDVERRPVAIG